MNASKTRSVPSHMYRQSAGPASAGTGRTRRPDRARPRRRRPPGRPVSSATAGASVWKRSSTPSSAARSCRIASRSRRLIAAKPWPPTGHRPPEVDVDVVPAGEPLGDRPVGHRVGVLDPAQRLVGEHHAEPETYGAITERFARWTDIDIHYRGEVTRSGGHGFSALGRRRPARHPAAARRGARRRPPLPDRGAGVDELGCEHDLVVAADGVNSAVRDHAAPTLRAVARPAPLQVHVARHRPRLRRLQVLHRRDASTASSRSTAIRTTTG